MKYEFPKYPIASKGEFTPGTFGENDWELGEINCVERRYYALPNGSEYAFFKFVYRTMTGKKRVRWETWRNGRLVNNHFDAPFDEAAARMENEIRFFGFQGDRRNYIVEL